MTVYSLPLALHWLGAAFALDYTNMEQMEKDRQSACTFGLAGVFS